MKKRRGKRLVAYIIAFAMIFSMGMTELSPIAEAAQYTILETDVSAPSTGCTMFGVYGTYYVDAQNGLNRINEIRKEVGDKIFFETLQEYCQSYMFQNVNGEQFMKLWKDKGVDINKIVDKCS